MYFQVKTLCSRKGGKTWKTLQKKPRKTLNNVGFAILVFGAENNWWLHHVLHCVASETKTKAFVLIATILMIAWKREDEKKGKVFTFICIHMAMIENELILLNLLAI